MKREFASGWPVVLGANLGIAVGVTAIPAAAIAVFMRALQAEFGWSRAELSVGPAILMGVVALMSPMVGWVADRVRAAWIAAVGLAALTSALVLFSRLGPSLNLYYLLFAATGVMASGAAAVPYARAVSAGFVRGRGLALGIAMLGIGISAALLPALLSPYAARVGWRQGYVALAVIVACAIPVVVALMSRQPAIVRAAPGVSDGSGESFAAALRDRAFWTLGACFILIPLSVGGMQLHLLSFLGDAGVSPATAGLIASSAGIVQIVSRLLSGWLVDRFYAPRVAATIMVIASLCIAGLAIVGAPAAPLGPIAFGIAMGSEIDLIGYMTARYFGMRAYGRLYGLLYAATMVGAGLSPIFFGSIYDATKGYTAALYAASGMLFVSALLFVSLRRPGRTDEHPQG
ncbi:MFS transporter [uncultured Sphingomonas sp.]|uniref:MFS transporter n=1 Tax=uncultured Sphingomonas sp. TaxID=158754 RepID=UPI0035C98031